MKKVTWRDRLRYKFDSTMSGGSAAIIGWLAVLSVTVVVVVSFIVWLGGIGPDDAQPMPFGEAIWASLMRTLDPGTMGGDTGWRFRFAMLAVTLGGIFVISTFIGVLTNSIDNKLDELLKGRSRVVETGHIVILNWSDHVFTVLNELRLAAAGRRECVVILGLKDKVEMEDAIRERLGPARNLRVVCRSGDSIEHTDLEIVSLDTARSIIVLSPDHGLADRDAQVFKTLLAILNHPERRPEPYHIVAELRDPRHVDIANLISRGEVELVVVGDLIARIIAQTSRQSGLSAVYTELLSYEGNELYLAACPEMTGKSYAEALLAYEHISVIGILSAGQAPRLNPPSASRIVEGDRLIVLAESSESLEMRAPRATVVESAICTQPVVDRPADRTLILGWNWRAPAILAQLDHYVTPGSAVMIVADVKDVHAVTVALPTDLTHLTVTVEYGNTTDRRVLDRLQLETYQCVIIMSYDQIPAQQADSRTMVTLLHLRDIADRCGQRFSIVSELLDVRNRRLVEITRPDDFIVSDQIVSLVLAQLAEVQELNAIFGELFDPEGMEIYIKPAIEYVRPDQSVTVATVVESARRRGETAIGFRRWREPGAQRQLHGIELNPPKSMQVSFGEHDRVIVIAEC